MLFAVLVWRVGEGGVLEGDGVGHCCAVWMRLHIEHYRHRSGGKLRHTGTAWHTCYAIVGERAMES